MRLLSLMAVLAAGSVALADDAQQLGRYEPGTASVDDAGHKYRYGYGGYRPYYGGYSYYRPSYSFYYGGGYGYYGGYRPYYYAPAPVFSYYYTPRWCGISNPVIGGVSLSIGIEPRQPLASGPMPTPKMPQVAPTPEPPNLDVKISDPAIRKAMRYPAYGDK